MEKFVLVMSLLAACILYPAPMKAINMPCSMVLEPVDQGLRNAKGAALVYQVQLPSQSFARTNVSILAVHLPDPTSYGNYDRYEGFAYIPNEISWRFTLYPTPEDESPTWSGRFDLITAKLDDARVQVRLSNSKSNQLGPSILTNHINQCK